MKLEVTEENLDVLLKNVTIDKDRVKRSVETALSLFNLKPSEVSISRQTLQPADIFISATEECNVSEAQRLFQGKYRNVMPAPVTIIQYKGKNVLFMGSNRSVVFILKGKNPDCVIIYLPDSILEPSMISEAKETLKSIIES